MVIKQPNGNYLASTCYSVGIAELDSKGKRLSLLGGADDPQAAAMKWMAFTCFEVLGNGHTMVCSWNGHRADDSYDGPQLIEFDERGKVVWSWHDPKRAGSIIVVAVVE